MYHRILIALQGKETDQAVVSHVQGLAVQTGAELVLLRVITAVPVLLLVLVRRARAYRRSPVGQAEGFLLRLTLEPEALLPALQRLATDEGRMTAIFPHLPGLARNGTS